MWWWIGNDYTLTTHERIYVCTHYLFLILMSYNSTNYTKYNDFYEMSIIFS